MSSFRFFEVHFKPMTFPAFHGRRGQWTRYDKIDAANLASMTVQPSLIRVNMYQDLDAVDLDCHFDPADYETATYGHVYGDGQFEDAVCAWLRSVFGLKDGCEGDVFYTESGAQRDDMISMELDEPFRHHLRHISNHGLLALTKRGDIKSIHTPDFDWAAPPEDPERQTDAS